MASGPTVEPADRSPEEIRRDIEATRADMGGTLTEIEDRVSPARIRERQTQRVRGRWNSMQEAVMGPLDQHRASSSEQDRGAEARDRLSNAPGEARSRTQGNPLAAGVIAFGAGLLAAAVIPSTEREQQAVGELRDRYEEPVKAELQSAGQQVKEELQPRAEEAAQQVKQTAQEGAQRTRDDAQESAQQVRGQAEGAREELRD